MGHLVFFSEFTRGKYRKVSREAPLKLLKSREGMEMKLVSGGDGVIPWCDEVEISALSATFGVVFWPYNFQMSSDGPVLWRIGKPMPKP